MDVVDARQSFLRWNQVGLEHLLAGFETDQQFVLELLPLLFHLNHRLLPGYTGPDTPAGIHGYKPEASIIQQARQLNARFNYQQETVLKNTVIDALYLQADVYSKRLLLWLVHFPGLRPDQFQELEQKLQRVLLWLNSRGVICQGGLLSAQQLAQKQLPASLRIDAVSPALFIEQFYLQARLLAGKYPAWWLLPPHKENDYPEWIRHLTTAMYVSPEEYLDLGGVATGTLAELLEQAIDDTQRLYRSPENGWFKLLILGRRFAAWPQVESPACRLKAGIHNGLSFDSMMPEDVYLGEIEAAIEQPEDREFQQTMNRLLEQLSSMPSDTWSPLMKRLTKSVSDKRPAQLRRRTGLSSYMSTLQDLARHTAQLFAHMVHRFKQSPDGERVEPLLFLAEAMMNFVAPGTTRVSVYNPRNIPGMLITRMILRYQPGALDRLPWELVMEVDEIREQPIARFSNLLILLAWARMNRIVDQSTQVSIDHPSRMVKQIEARHVLEVLIQQLEPERLQTIDVEVFKQPNTAVKGLLFSHLAASEDYQQRMASDTAFDPLLYGVEDELMVSCEQLIVCRWGDVYVQQYSGNLGVLQCLCDWTRYGDLQQAKAPPALLSYGYSSGISTFWSQRIEQIYQDVVQFFYTDKNLQGRFVVRMGPEYFLVSPDDSMLTVSRIGNEAAMLTRLEQASPRFIRTGLERFALTDTPLRDIYPRNREAVVQIFFQLINRQCHSWLLDENGSLWYQQHLWFDRSSYLAHWLYVMRNIRNRLKRINYQDRELPGLEIYHVTSSALGTPEFHMLGAESMAAQRGFIDIQLSVDVVDKGDRINLVCDGVEFSHRQHRDRVIDACVNHIVERFRREGVQPVYVTDVDVPLRLYGVEQRDDMQVTHFLRYKRNIENRLNQLIAQRPY